MTDEAIADITRHNQAVYDQIAVRYAGRFPGQGLWPAELGESFLASLPQSALVADLGCGPGHAAGQIAAAGHRVLGLDRSAGMLQIAGEVLPGRTVQADLRSLPFASASLDGAWCCAALLHVPHDETPATLAEMRRVLRPGGHLALVTAAGQGTRLEPVSYAADQHRWFFYRPPAELAEQLAGAGFRVLAVTRDTTNRLWLKILAVA